MDDYIQLLFEGVGITPQIAAEALKNIAQMFELLSQTVECALKQYAAFMPEVKEACGERMEEQEHLRDCIRAAHVRHTFQSKERLRNQRFSVKPRKYHFARDII